MNTLLEMFLNSPEWQTSQAERMFIIGIAAILRPDSVLEVGILNCACTRWLKKYASHITCIDMLKRSACEGLENVDFLMTKLITGKRKYDLVIIDADHTEPWAYKDTKNGIILGKVILFHDTMNAECRRGYQRAIDEEKDKIEFVDLSAIYNPTNWGGVGIVITK